MYLVSTELICCGGAAASNQFNSIRPKSWKASWLAGQVADWLRAFRA